MSEVWVQERRRPAVRFVRIVVAFLALAVLSWGSLLGTLAIFHADERIKAEGRLTLYSATLQSAIERYAFLPAILAKDRSLGDVAQGAPPQALNAQLAEFAALSGAEAIYLMNTEGLTLAASNYDLPTSFVGESYAFRPYFLDAVAGRTGTFFGVGATTGEPGYFVARPVRGAAGDVVGVAAVKVSLKPLERSWAESGDAIFVTNEDGIVVLASDPAWRYRTIEPLSPEEIGRIRANRQFAEAPLSPLKLHMDAGPRILGSPGASHLNAPMLRSGWMLHYLPDDGPAWTRAFLAVTVGLALATGVALGAQTWRNGRIRIVNARLACEIEERRAAERQLERIQHELRRTSRLAALGQLAASVNHELAQPIAAIRNHLSVLELRCDAVSEPTRRAYARIGGLLTRMEGIARQLKFFGKPGGSAMTRFDLSMAVSEALALVQPNLEVQEVLLSLRRVPDPVIVHGDRLRIEQVIVNLLRNGIDAMEECAERRLTVTTAANAGQAVIRVRDTGTGIGTQSAEEMAEPFHTSRDSGRGLGLGLAISWQIVREHGGVLTAWNADEDAGGAVFELRLPLAGDEVFET